MELPRIWADDDGASHFDTVNLPDTVMPAEHGVPELVHSAGLSVDRIHFLTVRDGTLVPDWHTAPRRQIVVFLTGWVRLETSDGEVRTMPAGSSVLVDDLAGAGHVTTHEPGNQSVLVLPLDPVDPLQSHGPAVIHRPDPSTHA